MEYENGRLIFSRCCNFTHTEMGRAEASAALAWMRFALCRPVHMSHVPVEGLWARCVVCFIYGVRVPLRRLCASRMCYRMNPRRTCELLSLRLRTY